MQKIRNPYTVFDGYHCFGCAPGNEHGLGMEFFLDGDRIVSRWKPAGRFQGYNRILHGGIQATLMDEMGSWAVNVLLGTAGMTIRLCTDYLKAVSVDDDELTLTARIAESVRRKAVVEVELADSSGEICSRAEIEFRVFPPELAKEKLHFPGREAFID